MTQSMQGTESYCQETALEYRKIKLAVGPLAFGGSALSVVVIGIFVQSTITIILGAMFCIVALMMLPKVFRLFSRPQPALARQGDMLIGGDVPEPLLASDCRYGFQLTKPGWNVQIGHARQLCSLNQDLIRLPHNAPMNHQNMAAALEAMGIQPGLRVRGVAIDAKELFTQYDSIWNQSIRK